MDLSTSSLAKKLRIGLKTAMLGGGFPTSALRRLNQSIVLFYHAIGEDGVPALALERQLRYLKRHFELIFASEIDQPSRSGRLRVAITFDDGLKNTRDVALPILEKVDAKATLFALPGDVRWLWTAETRERLERAKADGIVIDGDRPLLDERDIDRMIEEMKTMPHEALVAAIERIRAVTTFDPSPTWRASHELMTADELRALPRDRIEIGAHTLTHPILPLVDDDRLEREIVDGKRRLETALQRPVTIFSYPNGGFDRRCLEIAGRHYDYAFTTETAIGDYEDQAALDGHRHAVNRLHGVDHQADLPLRMLRFLQAGYGVRARTASPMHGAATRRGEAAAAYEPPLAVQE